MTATIVPLRAPVSHDEIVVGVDTHKVTDTKIT